MANNIKPFYLDSLSKKILTLYQSHPSFRFTIHDLVVKTEMNEMDLTPAVLNLFGSGYLKIDPNYRCLHKDELSNLGDTIAIDTPLCITRDGEVLLEETHRNERRFQYNEIRAWITLAIALLALIVSVIALFV